MAKGTNKQGLLRNVQNLNAILVKLAKEMENANQQLNIMMKGDANGPYWNGNKAKAFYSKAKSNMKNNAEDYMRALNKLNTLAVKYEQQVKADKG